MDKVGLAVIWLRLVYVDVEGLCAAMPAHALIPDTDPLTTSKRESIVAFAAEHRLPAVYGLRDFVVTT